ncbi:MAG: hypothetical protein ACKO24_10890 [Leptolyngbyaceae cyanobacterium]
MSKVYQELRKLPFGESFRFGNSTYRFVRACEAKDWKGIVAGLPPTDDRTAIEEIRELPGEQPRWVNHW